MYFYVNITTININICTNITNRILSHIKCVRTHNLECETNHMDDMPTYITLF